MNPWITIWTRTTETVDNLKDSNWVNRLGLLPYFFLGINAASESDILLLLGDSSNSAELIGIIVIIAVSGLFVGQITRVVWVNVIFYFGKIWRGRASRRNIDTVLSLCLIPEIFKFASLMLSFWIQDNLEDVQINPVITIICLLISVRILLIGLAGVQKFSFGIAVLNLVVPQLVWGLLYYSIRGI